MFFFKCDLYVNMTEQDIEGALVHRCCMTCVSVSVCMTCFGSSESQVTSHSLKQWGTKYLVAAKQIKSRLNSHAFLARLRRRSGSGSGALLQSARPPKSMSFLVQVWFTCLSLNMTSIVTSRRGKQVVTWTMCCAVCHCILIMWVGNCHFSGQTFVSFWDGYTARCLHRSRGFLLHLRSYAPHGEKHPDHHPVNQ